ncbi:uncharacterized protein LOC119434483 [Dermacentor silvarum]|uniref:uncharacterized protein LOC119434483 n=1 Tax=Dermacentor silvarum TaxID=543639 RepID=UPI001896BE81|nr:uncharacterized protein LOC119434483 [Dermacentor silvarum]
MVLFPGHHYLGPGSHKGKDPIDEDDRIAKHHDEAYERAESDADVFAADRASTKEFFHDFVSTGNWHSALGAVGLGAKNVVEEHVLGRSLYGMPPVRTGRKRANHGDSDPTAPKRVNDDPGPTSSDAEMSSAEELQSDAPARAATGGAGVGSNHPSSSECVQQILRVPRDHGVVSVFSDSKIVTTWGYCMLKTSLKYDSEKTFPGIVTSMSRLPVDRPYLYIPHGTYLNFPAHTKALQCSVKVTPHGLRTPWKTGSSVVQPVNSDMLVYGLASVGLNHHMDTAMCRITQGTTHNAMKPASIRPFKADDHAELAKSYWGLNIAPGMETQLNDDASNIPTSMGAPRHNFAYDFIHIENASPRLTKFVNQFPFKGHVGTPIINYEHKFKNAWLRMGHTYNAGNELLTHSSLGLPSDVVTYKTSNLSNAESNTQLPEENTVMRLRPLDFYRRHIRYLDTIEKSWYRRGLAPMELDAIQPSLAFGIMAVSKSNKDDPGSTDKFQDVTAFFQVDTELVVHSSLDTIAADTVMLPSSAGPYLRHTHYKIKLPYNSLSRHGRPAHLANTEEDIKNYMLEVEKIAAEQRGDPREDLQPPVRTLRSVSVPFAPE